jgi:uncharacterized RDD family membrane protein YckC
MSELNPYQAPKADLGARAGAPAPLLPTASGGARFVNLVVDYIVCQLISVVLGFLVGIRDLNPTNGQIMLLSLAIPLAYYLALEGSAGLTVGKLLTGTRVVRADGGKATVAQILGRTFARFVPFEPFSFFGSSSGGWHDRWSGTLVVRIRR